MISGCQTDFFRLYDALITTKYNTLANKQCPVVVERTSGKKEDEYMLLFNFVDNIHHSELEVHEMRWAELEIPKVLLA